METAFVLANLRTVLSLLGAIYWLLVTAILVPGVCLAYYLMPMSILRFISYDLYLKMDQKLVRLANDHWAAAAYCFGLTVKEYGDDVNRVSEDRCLVTVNHLGIIDHFIVMMALSNKGSVVENYLWIIFHIWKWTPLGVQWMLHGNFFVNGGKSVRQQVLTDLRNHLKENFWKNKYKWIVLYPEGTRLFIIKESSLRYAVNNGFPLTKHVALPRMGAVKAVLDVCGPKKNLDIEDSIQDHQPLQYIVDITLGFPHGQVPSMGDLANRSWPRHLLDMAVNYRILDIKDVPTESESELNKWFINRWVEKDELLEHFYQYGVFPGKQLEPKQEFSFTRILLTEAFWIGSMHIHMNLWIKPLLILVYGLIVGS